MNKYKQLYQQSVMQMQEFADNINRKHNPQLIKTPRAKYYTQLLESRARIMASVKYLWDKLPINLTSQQLETLFYDFFSLCFFEYNGILHIARYSMAGKLDPYGRLTKIKPIDFAGKSYDMELTPILEDGGVPSDNSKVCVIINDYTNSYSSTDNLSRAFINSKTTISDQVLTFEQLRTNIILSVKKIVANCANSDQVNQIIQQAYAMLDQTNPILVVDGGTRELSEKLEIINFSNNFDTQNYCQTIDYYDKLCRKYNGIMTPDTFEKKERKITAESENDNIDTQLILLDGYLQRLNGLALIKKYLKVEGIENITVSINDILCPSNDNEEKETDDDKEKDTDKGVEDNG